MKNKLILLLFFCAAQVSSAPLMRQKCQPLSNVFPYLMGMPEEDFLKKSVAQQKSIALKKLNQKQGLFYLHAVEPFSTNTAPLTQQSSFTFCVREGSGKKEAAHFLDTAQLQADPLNKNALFQVASNFDCLEACMGKKGTVSFYTKCNAQGEIASLSALPGLIDRLYLQPSANLLKNFCEKYTFTYSGGGFPELDETVLQKFTHLSETDIKDLASLLQVGVQQDIAVLFGKRDPVKKSIQTVTPCNRIHQVFTAALDPYNNPSDTPEFENLARIFLHAAYKGTLDVARSLKVKKIYLTLVGGGVFQNKLTWIAQALTASLEDFNSYPQEDPLEIILIIYDSSSYQDTDDWVEAKTLLDKQVKNSNGSWQCL